MAKRIGYTVLAPAGPNEWAPVMMLRSSEESRDAEAIFRALCDESFGPTDLLSRLGRVNTVNDDGRLHNIFTLSPDHKGIAKTLTVHWDYKSQNCSRPIIVEYER